MLEFESENQPLSTSVAAIGVPETELTHLLTVLPPAERVKFSGEAVKGTAVIIPRLEAILAGERFRRATKVSARSTYAFLTAAAFVICRMLNASPLVQIISLAALLIAAGFARFAKPDLGLEKAALDCLLSIEDKGVIGALLEQLRQGTEADRARVRQGLVGLLPLLREGDAEQLTGTQRAMLYDCVTSFWIGNLEFSIAAIDVLERLGDKHSLVPLYAVAARSAATHGEQCVRKAAQKCLHLIQSRLNYGSAEGIPEFLETIQGQFVNAASYQLLDPFSLYALLHLLPLLTPDSYKSILDLMQRERLISLLHPMAVSAYAYGQQALCREIIQTLARVQDTQAMPDLRRLASMEAPTDSEKQIRSAARDAVRTLCQLIEKEKESKTLLRGSSAPDDLPNELLRPAANAPSTTEPSELLRASTPEPPALRFPGVPPSLRRERHPEEQGP